MADPNLNPPASPEGGTPTSPEIEKLRTEIENLKTQNTELGGKNEDLSTRIETLQESLDSALEEMTLRGGQPPAEPEGGKPAEDIEPIEGKKGKETEVEKEIEKSIKEEETFRTAQDQRVEALELREEVRDLDSEIREAVTKFPSASEEEILLALEDMSDEEAENADISKLAEESHVKNSLEVNELKTKIEGDLKAQLVKEKEGGISVPQSPGSPSAPSTPAAPGAPPSTPGSDDLEWGNALKKAKVEGGGV